MDRSDLKLMVFDWDGTLSDSESRIVEAMQLAIKDLDLPEKSREEIKNIIGLGLYEAVLTLYPSYPEQTRNSLVEKYRTHYLSIPAANTGLFPGVYETIEKLHCHGYLLAIATGKSRRGLDRSLKETGLEDIFHASRCADECFSKPHPQMLDEIMADLGIDPNEALMIGDTEFDLCMAQNAGISAIAVTYGVHTKKRLLQYDPLTCLENMSQLWPWLVNGR